MPKPSKESKSQADWIAAVGEPTRLALLRALSVGAQTVTNLARELGTEIVNVSHHLSVMKDAGLVTVERDGRFMIYSLAGAAVVTGRLELTHPSGLQLRVPLE
ncbi:family transcriptional regulator : Probable transcription regulator OS=Planctomyces maris DSM 8797 GN=PM8797T_22538 PE=4 SV=1: HTH_20 [Gemmata massiliana]|uniref:HTH arsR-type domain-containing protein n=1 Tax=Gemmata massiliana TaxID=1210884 RepID=A0A6P2CWX5_9BACT|nr:metalloregulator ArsR/SmtB family transcription factor [Gemmata massiliana]VTR93403.1 family transcriptional regulator : Probable transcription regulator OS=Planctomyces maris DSM 8797 GN=PM8797T_22538 PE=4 SV=1: HTH_20 [Gemmata massiliana]